MSFIIFCMEDDIEIIKNKGFKITQDKYVDFFKSKKLSNADTFF